MGNIGLKQKYEGNTMPFLTLKALGVIMIVAMSALPSEAQEVQQVEANHVAEISVLSEKTYQNPFMEVELDAIVTAPDGAHVRVPAFWAGGKRWSFRYASSEPGEQAAAYI